MSIDDLIYMTKLRRENAQLKKLRDRLRRENCRLELLRDILQRESDRMTWICKHPLISLSPPNFGEKIECGQENRDLDGFCIFCGYHKEIEGLNRNDTDEPFPSICECGQEMKQIDEWTYECECGKRLEVE